MKSTIRVGNAQAFWGDRPAAAKELLSQVPDLDFLTMDYLAEVSMSILALQRERDASLGYPLDFVKVVESLVPYWNAGGRCRLIANAGGLNPMACALACKNAIENTGCRTLRIGVVQGDDVFHQLAQAGLQASNVNHAFRNLDTGAHLQEVQSRLVTANAYMGCSGIVESLNAGADIVITGRVADPSLVVAACVHAFQWNRTDWKRIAGATVAGHLLECGTHVTGGISTDWLRIPDPTHIGFPIAEIEDAGHCIVTKAPGTGGLVSVETVKEQLVYEIGDPSNYLSPDVSVSFVGLRVEQFSSNRISVSGAIGSPPSRQLKVSATYRDGYRAAGTLTIFGLQALEKAKRCGQMVLQRLQESGHRYRDIVMECLGNAESVALPQLARHGDQLLEIVLRLAVESESKEPVEAFTRELMPLVTAGPQGTTGYAEGRPHVHTVFRYWPCLIDSELVVPSVHYVETKSANPSPQPNQALEPEKNVENLSHIDATMTVAIPRKREEATCLFDVAYARSGDKGSSANIGVLSRSAVDYPWLLDWLTAERVKNYFAPLGVDDVERFALPNLCGLNFVIRGILKRGLRNDAQGKSLAQALLAMPINERLYRDEMS